MTKGSMISVKLKPILASLLAIAILVSASLGTALAEETIQLDIPSHPLQKSLSPWEWNSTRPLWAPAPTLKAK